MLGVAFLLILFQARRTAIGKSIVSPRCSIPSHSVPSEADSLAVTPKKAVLSRQKHVAQTGGGGGGGGGWGRRGIMEGGGRGDPFGSRDNSRLMEDCLLLHRSNAGRLQPDSVFPRPISNSTVV